MRVDRFVSTYICYPLLQLSRLHAAGHVPILMYHGVQDDLSGMSPYYETSVSPKVFRSHMKTLHDEGYRVIGLDDVRDACQQDETQKLAVVTFDDGFRNFYDEAFPILADFGFTATVYLATAFIENAGARFNGTECLTWTQVRELHAQGIGFGSHTVHHPKLKELEFGRIEKEIADSKKTIEDKLGAPVRSFSYPYAFPEANKQFKRNLRALLQENGYDSGVTTIIGTANARSDRYFLPRLPANNWDDFQLLRAKLRGGYDWLHAPQYLFKMLSSLTRN